ncbi:MAG: ABC transporter substrate binding protein [Myxococcota bacterium]
MTRTEAAPVLVRARRALGVFGLAIVTAGLIACQGALTGSEATTIVPPRRPNAPSILVVMPDAASPRQVLEGLVGELKDEFNLVPFLVAPDLTPLDLARAIRREQPKAVVLMNNPTLRVYRRYLASASRDALRIPAIAVLTSFLRETGEGVRNLTGVIYEVPLVTSLVNLRALLSQPIQRVGVVYRPIFKAFLAEQRRLSATEGFELVGLSVSGKDEGELRDALTQLRREVDAIWVLNDNRLLKRDMLLDGWLPALQENRVPVIVNALSLVSSDVSFGTFAVLPDHRALGAQTGQMISTLADNGWQFGATKRFEYPISVQKVLDLNFARRHLEIKEAQLATVDRLVE